MSEAAASTKPQHYADAAGPETGRIDTEAERIGAQLESLLSALQDAITTRRRRSDEAVAGRLAELRNRLTLLSADVESVARRVGELESAVAENRRAPRASAAVKKADSAAAAARAGVPRARRATFPPLPRTLTLRGLERYLDGVSSDFDVANHRRPGMRSGGFWVFTEKATLQPLVEMLAERGVSCRYYEAGRRTRDPRAAWEIDNTKSLS